VAGLDDNPERRAFESDSEERLNVLPGTRSFAVSIDAHQGGLPPPEFLDDYERVPPGATAWISAEARDNAVHTTKMEYLGLTHRTRTAGYTAFSRSF
jgi:hypothetical protein